MKSKKRLDTNCFNKDHFYEIFKRKNKKKTNILSC
jgi:hypothetical protein